MAECAEEIADRLSLDHDQASELVDIVLHSAWEAVGDRAMNELRSKLPPDWGEMIGRA